MEILYEVLRVLLGVVGWLLLIALVVVGRMLFSRDYRNRFIHEHPHLLHALHVPIKEDHHG